MIRSKKLIVIVTAVIMVSMTWSCTREKEIRIGFAGQLTGVYSDLGVQGRNGAALAVEEINTGGGVAGKRLRLIPEDDGNTPEKARQAVRKLIQQEVTAIVGHMTSGQSLAGLPVAEKAGVVMLSPTTSTPALIGKKDMFFRVQPSTVHTAESLGWFAAENLKLEQVSTVRDLDNDAYTAPFNQHFIRHFEKAGGRIAATCTFSSSDTDNWSQVLACLALDRTQGVLVMASARDMVSMIQAMDESGKDQALLSSGWGATRELLAQGDQILANLCVNARDAISGVGTITIQTGMKTVDQAYCADNADCIPGEYVLLTVGDNGHGMDKETMARIFDPFFTTKELGRGTGLGLATLYGIVKQNNGFIHVTSNPGQGTTFTIHLPRYASSFREPVDEKPAASPAAKGTETILVVEDEPTILDITRMMLLERQGYTVLAAGTPGEALARAETHQGKIHLVLTDVIMPEMNGRELGRRVQALYPDIQCLYMSGYTADVIAHQGVLDQGTRFIQKPFSMRDLAVLVREILDA
jgi:ABC-type branched-subunit amino acid transport system substrate-binding protein/CheY-like chemotaxis protein